MSHVPRSASSEVSAPSVSRKKVASGDKPDASLDAEAERIAELMDSVGRTIFKAGHKGPPKLKPEAMQLTIAQMRCLRVLSHQENCTMRDLSRHLGVRPSTACELVDALVKTGMVRRDSDPQDRRVVRLNLAPKGRRLKDKHGADRRAHLRAAIENLSDEERHAVVGALETLAGVLQGEGKERRTEEH